MTVFTTSEMEPNTRWAQARKKVGKTNVAGEERLFHQLKPFLIILQLLGRFPYLMHSEGVKNFQLFSIITLYSVLMYLAQLYLTTISITKVAGWKEKHKPDGFLWVNFVFGFVHNIIVPLTFWMDSFDLAKYFRLWDEFQDTYNQIMKTRLKFNFAKKIKIHLIFFMPLVLVMSSLLGKHLRFGLSLKEAFLTFFPILGAFWMTNGILIVSLLEIRNISNKISERIVQWDVDGREAGDLRRLWIHLIKLLKALGDALGNSMIAFGASTFINSICTIASLVVCLSSCSEIDLSFLEVLFLTVAYFLGWVVFLEIISQTSDIVGKKFSKVLLNINFELRHPLYQREIQLILLSLDLYPPKISMKGMFIADRNLTRLLIKSMLTYIIILLQSVPSKKKSEEFKFQ